MKPRLILGAALLAAACASQRPTARPHSAAAVSLGRVAFMAGTWVHEDGDEVSEESWLEPRGDALVGVNRTVKAGQTVFYEHLRLTADVDGGVTYWASPRGATATAFALTAHDAGWARFENPEHDFPKRITYWRGDEAGLCAQIEGAPDAGSSRWCWTRQE